MEIPSYRYRALRARRKRQLKMRLLAAALALLIFGSCFSYSYAAFHKPLPEAAVMTRLPQSLAAENVDIPWPAGAQSAIGSSDDGVLMASSASEEARPIASVAKVITALAVMRAKPFGVGQPGGLLKFDGQDIEYYNDYIAKGGSVTPINFGQELSEYDALQALLLPSSNNMADSLARWAFGSLDAYKAYANAMLKDYGLTRSSVDDASGFSPRTVSTASELVILGQKLLGNEILAKIVAEREATIPVAGTISNVNRLLADPEVIGIKTGNTDEAGGCLLFAAKHAIDDRHYVTIIGAVVGSASISTVFPESTRILTAAKAGFSGREVAKAGTVVAKLSTGWGATTDLVTAAPIVVYGWKGSEVKPELKIGDMASTIKAGETAGILTAAGGNHSVSVEVKPKTELKAPSMIWRLKHYF